MTPKIKNGIYATLGVVNAALLACVETGAFNGAPKAAHYVALASLVVAAMLPKFGAASTDGGAK